MKATASNDPKLRLGQLLDALLRDCRYIGGIEMHTGYTYNEGIRFFMKEGYMTKAYAERGNKARYERPHLSRLHVGQAAN